MIAGIECAIRTLVPNGTTLNMSGLHIANPFVVVARMVVR
jgi:hypothetical protein